jgi:hypothetical protein
MLCGIQGSNISNLGPPTSPQQSTASPTSNMEQHDCPLLLRKTLTRRCCSIDIQTTSLPTKEAILGHTQRDRLSQGEDCIRTSRLCRRTLKEL